MLTNTGLALEFIKRGWHCPWCINTAVDAIKINFTRKHPYAQGFGDREVRIYHEVAQEPMMNKIVRMTHTMRQHEGDIWGSPDLRWEHE